MIKINLESNQSYSLQNGYNTNASEAVSVNLDKDVVAASQRAYDTE